MGHLCIEIDYPLSAILSTWLSYVSYNTGLRYI